MRVVSPTFSVNIKGNYADDNSSGDDIGSINKCELM